MPAEILLVADARTLLYCITALLLLYLPAELLLVADARTLVTLLKKELPPLPHSAFAPALDGRMPKPAAFAALLLYLLYCFTASAAVRLHSSIE